MAHAWTTSNTLTTETISRHILSIQQTIGPEKILNRGAKIKGLVWWKISSQSIQLRPVIKYRIMSKHLVTKLELVLALLLLWISVQDTDIMNQWKTQLWDTRHIAAVRRLQVVLCRCRGLKVQLLYTLLHPLGWWRTQFLPYSFVSAHVDLITRSMLTVVQGWWGTCIDSLPLRFAADINSKRVRGTCLPIHTKYFSPRILLVLPILGHQSCYQHHICEQMGYGFTDISWLWTWFVLVYGLHLAADS